MADFHRWLSQQRDRDDDVGRVANMTLDQLNRLHGGTQLLLSAHREFNTLYPSKAEPMKQPKLGPDDLIRTDQSGQVSSHASWGPLDTQPIGNTVKREPGPFW